MSDINRRTEVKTFNERMAIWEAEDVGSAILHRKRPTLKMLHAGISTVTLNL